MARLVSFSATSGGSVPWSLGMTGPPSRGSTRFARSIT